MPKKTLEILQEALKPIVDRLDKLENTISKPITSNAEAFNEAKPVEPTPEPVSVAVPRDWLTEVHNVLNNEFPVEIEPHQDAPLTTFSIIVPDKYSQMTPSQREVIKRDIRPKVITNAGGTHEIREWAETVFKNLTPEIQAMVVSDRMRA